MALSTSEILGIGTDETDFIIKIKINKINQTVTLPESFKFPVHTLGQWTPTTIAAILDYQGWVQRPKVGEFNMKLDQWQTEFTNNHELRPLFNYVHTFHNLARKLNHGNVDRLIFNDIAHKIMMNKISLADVQIPVLEEAYDELKWIKQDYIDLYGAVNFPSASNIFGYTGRRFDTTSAHDSTLGYVLAGTNLPHLLSLIGRRPFIFHLRQDGPWHAISYPDILKLNLAVLSLYHRDHTRTSFISHVTEGNLDAIMSLNGFEGYAVGISNADIPVNTNNLIAREVLEVISSGKIPFAEDRSYQLKGTPLAYMMVPLGTIGDKGSIPHRIASIESTQRTFISSAISQYQERMPVNLNHTQRLSLSRVLRMSPRNIEDCYLMPLCTYRFENNHEHVEGPITPSNIKGNASVDWSPNPSLITYLLEKEQSVNELVEISTRVCEHIFGRNIRDTLDDDLENLVKSPILGFANWACYEDNTGVRSVWTMYPTIARQINKFTYKFFSVLPITSVLENIIKVRGLRSLTILTIGDINQPLYSFLSSTYPLRNTGLSSSTIVSTGQEAISAGYNVIYSDLATSNPVADSIDLIGLMRKMASTGAYLIIIKFRELTAAQIEYCLDVNEAIEEPFVHYRSKIMAPVVGKSQAAELYVFLIHNLIIDEDVIDEWYPSYAGDSVMQSGNVTTDVHTHQLHECLQSSITHYDIKTAYGELSVDIPKILLLDMDTGNDAACRYINDNCKTGSIASIAPKGERQQICAIESPFHQAFFPKNCVPLWAPGKSAYYETKTTSVNANIGRTTSYGPSSTLLMLSTAVMNYLQLRMPLATTLCIIGPGSGRFEDIIHELCHPGYNVISYDPIADYYGEAINQNRSMYQYINDYFNGNDLLSRLTKTARCIIVCVDVFFMDGDTGVDFLEQIDYAMQDSRVVATLINGPICPGVTVEQHEMIYEGLCIRGLETRIYQDELQVTLDSRYAPGTVWGHDAFSDIFIDQKLTTVKMPSPHGELIVNAGTFLDIAQQPIGERIVFVSKNLTNGLDLLASKGYILSSPITCFYDIPATFPCMTVVNSEFYYLF